MENLTEMLKDVLEGCVLEIISRGQTYGYEITRKLNALGFTDVVDGTTYTILIRLEKNELVDVEKRPSDKGPPRNFFTLNDAGREELRRYWERWDFVASKINHLRREKMSDFFDTYFNIPKMIKSKREYKQQMARVEALPEDYRYVFKKIQSHMWMFAAGSGYDMMKIHHDLIELFETGVTEGKHV